MKSSVIRRPPKIRHRIQRQRLQPFHIADIRLAGLVRGEHTKQGLGAGVQNREAFGIIPAKVDRIFHVIIVGFPRCKARLATIIVVVAGLESLVILIEFGERNTKLDDWIERVRILNVNTVMVPRILSSAYHSVSSIFFVNCTSLPTSAFKLSKLSIGYESFLLCSKPSW